MDMATAFGRVLRTGLSSLRDRAASRLAALRFNPSRYEFRPDSKGNFDELVARFADGGVFFEDLGENGLFVDIYWNDGRGVRLWAGAKRGCLTYNHEADAA
jgi:hypothetical protein